jgi:large subunit ribosomal protein L29
MKAVELRTKTVEDLQKLLADTKKDLIEAKRSLAAGELPNPRVVGKNRRLIARINTLLTAKRNEEKGEA